MRTSSKHRPTAADRSDPYRWLEHENDPRTRRWVRTQAHEANAILKKLPLRPYFVRRFKKLLHAESFSLPLPRKDGTYFHWERKPTQELFALYMRKGLRGKKRLVIDENKLSRDRSASVRSWSVSPDVTLLAYGISAHSNDQQALHVMDLRTRKNLRDVIPADVYPCAHSNIIWDQQGVGFWYTRRAGRVPKSEHKLHQKLFFHRLGTDWRKDPLVFGRTIQKEETPQAQLSSDRRYLLVTVRSSGTTKQYASIYIKDLQTAGPFRTIVKRMEDNVMPWIHRDRFYVQTNHRAPNWKVMGAPLAQALKGPRYWKTIIPEGAFPLEEVRCVQDRMFVHTLENIHAVLAVCDLDGKHRRSITLPEMGTIVGISSRAEGDEVFIGFTSFATPFNAYRYDLKQHCLTLFKKQKIAFNQNRFMTCQVWFRSKDGTRVPMFLVHKKGLRRTGTNPVFLYGYGGFNNSLLPGFNALRIPFLEKGGIYAVVNLRGGGEFGERWHRAGMLGKKQNVFDDFIAAAEWLIRQRYTSKQHIAAYGGSNGGLLVTAMLTQRPDLFKAAIADVPVTDMLRFHLFHGGRHWIRDYGNPDDPKDRKYLLRYSPYHNLTEGKSYPATLLMTAEGDDRVHPMHAYKFFARLREANSSNNPILLRVETKAGHAGGASVSKTIEGRADIYAFIAWQLGMH